MLVLLHIIPYLSNILIPLSLFFFIIFLLVYVDDILLRGNNADQIAHIAALLHATFCIKNLGNLYFLGFETRNHTSLNLNQRK